MSWRRVFRGGGIDTWMTRPLAWQASVPSEAGARVIESVETFDNGHVAVVRVRAADGGEGFGQTAPHNADITAHVLHRHIAPQILGFDGDDVEGLSQRCLDTQAKYAGSYLARALGGVDTALWDLRARRSGVSVAALCGGAARRVAVYGSWLRRDTDAARTCDILLRAREEHGFSAFKIKIGRKRGRDRDEWAGRTEALVPAVRQALGGDVALYADANSGYGAERAIEVGRLLEEFGYAQFEEPCPHQELEETARVAAALEIDIAGGEQDHDLAQFRRMFAMRAVDVVTPDVGYAGGFTQARRVAALAAQAGIPCQPHAANRSLTMVFAMHLMASIQRPTAFLECSIEPLDDRLAFSEPRLDVREGEVAFSERPGWGVSIDPLWLRRARRRTSRLRESHVWRLLRSARLLRRA